MIGWLQGRPLEYWTQGNRSGVLLVCGGVGYEVHLPARPQQSLAAEQQGAGDAPSLDPDLERWATSTRQLLQQIAQEGDGLGAHRSAQQVMALGSFRTHLMLGLQALKAARS